MSASRQLPAQPNLNHLRNEAKALHRAYLTGDTVAATRVRAAIGDRSGLKLVDAQRVIASEYGFVNWSALRAEVAARRESVDATGGNLASSSLTTRTYIAIGIARAIAAANGHEAPGACHLALGILREGENPAVVALYRAGVPIRELRQALESQLPPRGTRAERLTFKASSAERVLLNLARTEAAARGAPFVANEHLFLALLREQDSSLRGVFADYRISYAHFSQHLDAVLTGL